MNYSTAKQELEQWLDENEVGHSKLHYAQKVLLQIEQLHQKGKLSSLDSTVLLHDTRALLSHTLAADAYLLKARNVQGNSSLAMQVLGTLMMVLGGLVAGGCALLAATTGIILSGEGLAGAGILAAGFGLFSGGFRSGLSKAMHELEHEVKRGSLQEGTKFPRTPL